MILRHIRSNVVAYLALLVAMSGTSYAAVQIANGSVTTRKLAGNAVVSAKVRNEGIKSIDVRNNAIGSGDLRDNAVNSSDLQDGSVSSVDVKNDTLLRADIADGVVPRDAHVFVSTAGNPPITSELAAQQPFTFTMPRNGKAVMRFFAGELGIDCTAGTGSVGMYVDGVAVPGTATLVPSVADGGAVELLAETENALASGAHTVSIGEDCATGDRVGATPVGERRATWTVELLAR